MDKTKITYQSINRTEIDNGEPVLVAKIDPAKLILVADLFFHYRPCLFCTLARCFCLALFITLQLPYINKLKRCQGVHKQGMGIFPIQFLWWVILHWKIIGSCYCMIYQLNHSYLISDLFQFPAPSLYTIFRYPRSQLSGTHCCVHSCLLTRTNKSWWTEARLVPIMLSKLPIMLLRNAAEICLLCSNYGSQINHYTL